MSTGDAGSLTPTLDRISRDVRGILARVLDADREARSRAVRAIGSLAAT